MMMNDDESQTSSPYNRHREREREREREQGIFCFVSFFSLFSFFCLKK